MVSNVDKVVQVYRSLAQIPALTGASLSNKNSIVQSVWSQRNLERGKTTKFTKSFVLSSDLTKLHESLPVDISSELLSAISPSEQYRAVLRDLNEKQYLEIWQSHNLTRSVDLNTLDVHGNVYTDVTFASFRWSPDEKKLLYIAEEKIPKSDPFYKRSAKKDKGDDPAEKSDAEKPRGEEYLFKQDWGEQLVGKKKSIIAQYNVESDEVEILKGLPEDICPSKVKYSPDGSFVAGVAYKTEPRKLGLIYCSNRASTIFTLDFNGNFVSFPLENKSVMAPIFTPDGKTLLWLQRDVGGPHASCMALMKTSLSQISPKIVVDVVKTSVKTANGTNFYGLFNQEFVKRCWASGDRLVVSTNQQNTVNSYLIDIETGSIIELVYNEGSQIVLDVVDDIILVNRRNFLKQDKLAICKLPPKNSEVPLNWIELTSGSNIAGLENCIYEYLDLVQPDSNDSVKNFSAIYVGPKSGAAKSTTLIVWPHGGPHSAFANNLSLEASLFLSFGYGVLLVNYRGSTGAGQDNVDFLLGRIGSSDVSDCILATKTAVNKYAFLDSTKMVLVGGSHGGFLVAHLSGQYPDMFKAVVARNPVIDVASMSVISDIPDWCYAEAGAKYTQKGKIDDTALMKMRQASPIEYAHNVKAPTLLQIGSKDLRVPPHQGFEYYTRLKANGVDVRMNLYDDNHPLGTVPNEMDNLINTVLWIQKSLQ